MAGQEPICFHIKLFLPYLHYKGCPKVYKVRIANVGEKHVRKTFWIGSPQRIKLCLPIKIYQVSKSAGSLYPIIVLLKMVVVYNFYMLHVSGSDGDDAFDGRIQYTPIGK